MNIAVFPGSFDPITVGHESIIRRALPLFDKLIIAIGSNADKRGFFTIEQRIEWIKEIFNDSPKVEVDVYQGLTIDYCKQVDARFILRGLRTAADFEFERGIGQINKKLYKDIETVFMLTTPEHTMINSSIVRDIIRHGGETEELVPACIDVKNGKRI